MRDDSAGRTAAALQREVLRRGNALHPVRSRDRVYVSVGGRLPRRDQARQRDLLEHARFYYGPDGWLRVRPQKRRARFQKITPPSLASAGSDSLHPTVMHVLQRSAQNDVIEHILPHDTTPDDVELSIVIPAMNEEITVGEFMEWCKEGLQRAGVSGQILIVDSSTDNTPAIVLEH